MKLLLIVRKRQKIAFDPVTFFSDGILSLSKIKSHGCSFADRTYHFSSGSCVVDNHFLSSQRSFKGGSFHADRIAHTATDLFPSKPS
jgi:hypothetical protein